MVGRLSVLFTILVLSPFVILAIWGLPQTESSGKVPVWSPERNSPGCFATIFFACRLGSISERHTLEHIGLE